MLAIETYYIGPTNFRGSRIKARVMESASMGQPRTLTVDYDDSLDSEANHRAAALALIQRLEWTRVKGYAHWVVGSAERGYVFVCAVNGALLEQQ